MPRSAALQAYSGQQRLRHRCLLAAGPAARLAARPCNQHQLRLLAPHRDVGDVVLQRLELADQLAEGAPLIHVREGVLEHAVDHAEAHGGIHDALAVQRLRRVLPALSASPSSRSSGTKTSSRATAQELSARMPSFGSGGDRDARGSAAARRTATRRRCACFTCLFVRAISSR